MSLQEVIRRGRAFEQLSMLDRCTIREPGTRRLNRVSGEYEQTQGAVVYAGVCELLPRDNADRVVEAAGATVSLWPYIVRVPVDGSEAVALDHEVTIDSSAMDAAAVGLQLRVREAPKGSMRTARRLGCELQEQP